MNFGTIAAVVLVSFISIQSMAQVTDPSAPNLDGWDLSKIYSGEGLDPRPVTVTCNGQKNSRNTLQFVNNIKDEWIAVGNGGGSLKQVTISNELGQNTYDSVSEDPAYHTRDDLKEDKGKDGAFRWSLYPVQFV